jgi:hypothetical protein
MLLIIINLFVLSIAVSVVGFTYTEILIYEKILNWWYKLCEKYIGKYDWLFYPIVFCFKCVTGQLAFWSYIFIPGEYHFAAHIYFVCQAILNVVFIKLVFDKLS